MLSCHCSSEIFHILPFLVIKQQACNCVQYLPIEYCLMTVYYLLHIALQRAQCEQSVLKVNMIRADLQWRLVQLRLHKDAFEATQISNLQKG